MKPAIIMEPGDRALFRYQAGRNLDAYTFDDPVADRKVEGRKDRQRSKKAFKEMRIRRSRSYHRGKKKWRTLEVRESASVKQAREFYLHCQAKEGK
jgi:hypothetical protein